MTVEWIQQIEEALKTLGEENNFEVLSADANRDINTQLSQIDTAIEQKIDGAFLFIVDEGSAPAAVQKFDDAEIPVIGETLKLQDGDGKNIAPYVELDAEGVGSNCGKWVAENWESTGVDLSDLSKVGVIQNTNSKYRSDLARIDGFMNELNGGLPGIPESNVFMADCAAEATSNDNTEASYNQVAAVLSAHPEIEAWIIMGSVDSYAMGACRAVEAAGLEEKTILVSAGGELAIKEWANESGACWRATCYYDAMDFAEKMVEGMLSVCRDGETTKDIYSDFKEGGDEYAAVKISGNMCTAENYQDFTE
ncbi:sugar ABC transporter substrate-binding protein [Lachnospiraceae bacterium OF09-33XD]|nr:sugar ABC transporter substrate-binding protein [Lachnospiraceae bacterium OF09-33XD]